MQRWPWSMWKTMIGHDDAEMPFVPRLPTKNDERANQRARCVRATGNWKITSEREPKNVNPKIQSTIRSSSNLNQTHTS